MESAKSKNPRDSALRRGRFSQPGRAYLVTTVVHQRRPLFSDFRLARRTVRELRECNAHGRCQTLAYVLMPNHLHWLFQLESGDLATVLKLFKARSGKVINHCRGTPGEQIWQRGFHDHALRKEEDLVATARYIIANPLHAGLVQTITDYPHWDAIWL